MEKKQEMRVSTPLTDEALLRARGWTSIGVGGVGLEWRTPQGGYRYCDVTLAAKSARGDASSEAWEHGSVTYRATAEQKRSPILSALDGKAIERDVITKLAERVDSLETELCRAFEAKASDR